MANFKNYTTYCNVFLTRFIAKNAFLVNTALKNQFPGHLEQSNVRKLNPT